MARGLLSLLAKEAECLYLTARQKQSLLPLKKELSLQSPCRLELLELDVLDPQQSQKGLERVLGSGPPLELFISMPGYVGDSSEGKTAWPKTEELGRIMDTNYRALVPLLNQVGEYMEKKGRGMIIGVSSIAGERCRKKHYLYGSAKAAFTAYLSGLRARLYPKGVHVMTVLPGLVNTKMLEGKKYPPFLSMSPQRAAKSIYKGIRKKRNVLYVHWFWRWIILAIRLLPESCFKRLNIS